MTIDPAADRIVKASPTPPVRNEFAAIASELPATAEAVPAARSAVVAFARTHGAGPTERERIALAVSEAVTNVVRHAYPAGAQGPVRYVAEVEDDRFQVVVADAGGGLADTRHRDPGLGMGLQLIADVTSDFALTTIDGGGFEVRMCFILGGA
jgi:serine/threonine-protein kinase RsbW